MKECANIQVVPSLKPVSLVLISTLFYYRGLVPETTCLEIG